MFGFGVSFDTQYVVSKVSRLPLWSPNDYCLQGSG